MSGSAVVVKSRDARRLPKLAPVEQPPNVFLLISDRPDQSADVQSVLRSVAEVHVRHPSALEPTPQPYLRIIVDIDLADIETVRLVRRQLEEPALRGQPRDFIIDPHMHRAKVQAHALDATKILTRPLGTEAMLTTLRAAAARRFQDSLASGSTAIQTGVSEAHQILMQVFEGVGQGAGPTFNDIVAHEDDITKGLQHTNLQGWIDLVREHHSHSYRHCLFVTGFSGAFGSYLGLSLGDQVRLARAAMMHDVGKAFTPIAILDKPGKLTEDELVVMRRHPRQGYNYLAQQSGFTSDDLDVALHHHEMLDGSGYPDRLSGSAISDMVRMVTVVDVFAALVEDRPYRPAMKPTEALAVLHHMGHKLDRDLVREFSAMITGSYGKA